MIYPDLPASSHDHTTLVLNDKAFLIGGLSNIQDPILSLDLKSLENENNTWVKFDAPKAESLAQTNGHSAVAGNNFILTFFGETPPANPEPVTYINVDSANAFQISFPESIAPIHRSGHGALSHGNTTFIFGGYGMKSGSALNDLRALNMHTGEWISLPESYNQNAPSTRIRSSFLKVKHDQFILVCFGETEGGVLRDDCKIFDLKDLIWKDIQMINSPPPRQGFTLIENPSNADSLVLYGGMSRSGKTVFNDLWQADISDMPNSISWSEIEVKDSAKEKEIKPRWNHDNIVWENELVIIGGLESMDDRTGTADVFSINFNDLDIKPTGPAPINFGLIFGLLFMCLSLLVLGVGFYVRRKRRIAESNKELFDEVEQDFGEDGKKKTAIDVEQLPTFGVRSVSVDLGRKEKMDRESKVEPVPPGYETAMRRNNSSAAASDDNRFSAYF